MTFKFEKKQVGQDRVERKIDRALVNEEWKQVLGFSKASFDSPLLSYHSPSIFSTVCDMTRIKGYPFRYKNFWGEEKQLKEVVGASWM